MRKLLVLSIVILTAVAFAVTMVPVFAVKDFRALNSSTDAGEAALAAGGALAANALAGGTVRSLIPIPGKKEERKPLHAVEALFFSVSTKGSSTLWLVALAKFFTAIAVIFEGSPFDIVTTTIPTILSIAAIGSAFSAIRILTTPTGTTEKKERSRINMARGLGFVVFLILLAVFALYLSSPSPS
jgi:hypothetical protein